MNCTCFWRVVTAVFAAFATFFLPAGAANAAPVEIPADVLGRYTYTAPDCFGTLELLPVATGYRVVINTTCSGAGLCSETLAVHDALLQDDGTLALRSTHGIELELRGLSIEVPSAADYLCLYDAGRMSGNYIKYEPSELVRNERRDSLERSLGLMQRTVQQVQGELVRDQSYGTPFPLGSQSTDLSGVLMEAYLANPSARVPANATRADVIAALIAYHRKVLESIGYSLEMSVIDAFASRDFSYWGFLKTSRRADVAAPYLAILDSPEVLETLLERGVISRQVVNSLIDFAPWYKTSFP